MPFPGLDRVNAFVLYDEHGSTLVDCGMQDPGSDKEQGWGDLTAALAACDVPLPSIARLVVTHTHIDHYGLAGRLLAEAAPALWMHAASSDELEAYRNPAAAAATLREMFHDHGIGDEDTLALTAFEDWRTFVSDVVEPNHYVTGGETFRCGDRDWEIVHTPGHARSHVCVWNARDRILISGDHLLPAITPHIDFVRGAEPDPLGRFLDSLQKVEDLDPSLVLPGHGHPFEDGAERARVVARHHDRRLGAVLQVIRHQPRTAAEITDEIFGTTLLNFERRLALGEALAHIAYLRRRGEIERIQRDDGTFVFKKVARHRSQRPPDG